MTKTSHTGFQLLELLITLAIIGVLISLSVPLFSQPIVQERRLEAAHFLSRLSVALEQYHIEHETYRGATLQDLNFPEWIVNHHYQLTMNIINDEVYLLMAIPLANQKDPDCGTLTLNANGEKKVTGPGKVQDCW